MDCITRYGMDVFFALRLGGPGSEEERCR